MRGPAVPVLRVKGRLKVVNSCDNPTTVLFLLLSYSIAITVVSVTPFTVNDQPKPKITRLPRNGPKVGQSYEQWQYGKSKDDESWNRRKRRYAWRQMRYKRQ